MYNPEEKDFNICINYSHCSAPNPHFLYNVSSPSPTILLLIWLLSLAMQDSLLQHRVTWMDYSLTCDCEGLSMKMMVVGWFSSFVFPSS